MVGIQNQVRILNYLWNNRDKEIRFGNLARDLDKYMRKPALINNLKALKRNKYIKIRIPDPDKPTKKIYKINLLKARFFPYGNIKSKVLKYFEEMREQAKVRINKQSLKGIIDVSYQIEIIQKEIIKDIIIGRKKYYELKNKITEILYEYFIMNPENWLVFQELENFNFSIIIDSQLNKVPNLMDYYNQIKQDYRKKDPRLQQLTDQEIYDIANSELKRIHFKSRK